MARFVAAGQLCRANSISSASLADSTVIDSAENSVKTCEQRVHAAFSGVPPCQLTISNLGRSIPRSVTRCGVSGNYRRLCSLGQQ